MSRNPTQPTKNPRIRLLADGRVTISGLNYRDASHILTMAHIRYYQNDKESRKKLAEVKAEIAANPDEYLNDIKLQNAWDNIESDRKVDWICKTLREKLQAQYGYTPPKLSLKEQLRKNKKDRESRKRITDVALAGGNWIDQLIKEAEL